MTLRNAFEGLATESTLKRLLVQLHFARDPADQLRVVVAGNPVLGAGTSAVGYVSPQWADRQAYAAWYAVNGSPASMDPREQQRMASVSAATQARSKWIYT